MNERSGRHSRVSPSPGKGATAAYTLCPTVDPDLMMTGSNMLSIPLSAITLPTKNTIKDPKGTNTKHPFRFLMCVCLFAFHK